MGILLDRMGKNRYNYQMADCRFEVETWCRKSEVRENTEEVFISRWR